MKFQALGNIIINRSWNHPQVVSEIKTGQRQPKICFILTDNAVPRTDLSNIYFPASWREKHIKKEYEDVVFGGIFHELFHMIFTETDLFPTIINIISPRNDLLQKQQNMVVPESLIISCGQVLEDHRIDTFGQQLFEGLPVVYKSSALSTWLRDRNDLKNLNIFKYKDLLKDINLLTQVIIKYMQFYYHDYFKTSVFENFKPIKSFIQNPYIKNMFNSYVSLNVNNSDTLSRKASFDFELALLIWKFALKQTGYLRSSRLSKNKNEDNIKDNKKKSKNKTRLEEDEQSFPDQPDMDFTNDSDSTDSSQKETEDKNTKTTRKGSEFNDDLFQDKDDKEQSEKLKQQKADNEEEEEEEAVNNNEEGSEIESDQPSSEEKSGKSSSSEGLGLGHDEDHEESNLDNKSLSEDENEMENNNPILDANYTDFKMNPPPGIADLDRIKDLSSDTDFLEDPVEMTLVESLEKIFNTNVSSEEIHKFNPKKYLKIYSDPDRVFEFMRIQESMSKNWIVALVVDRSDSMRGNISSGLMYDGLGEIAGDDEKDLVLVDSVSKLHQSLDYINKNYDCEHELVIVSYGSFGTVIKSRKDDISAFFDNYRIFGNTHPELGMEVLKNYLETDFTDLSDRDVLVILMTDGQFNDYQYAKCEDYFETIYCKRKAMSSIQFGAGYNTKIEFKAFTKDEAIKSFSEALLQTVLTVKQ